MKIIGIIGLKNSGKTFLAKKLISHFVKQNFKVASIKHAHHNFDIDQPGTDSYIHRESGSQQIIISSQRRWAKISELKDKKEKTLSELIKEISEIDIVIVEGYKNEDHNKIEIINELTPPSRYLFPKIKNIIGIVSNKEVDASIKQFKSNQINIIANHILQNT
tara:strand:- start:317 stop:805 length:489 start_codon:yes stop_codon:yes gene_type:complete